MTTNLYSNGEIQITDGEMPSYLQYNIMERIDILYIKINLSISRIDGTVFYYVDKNKEQVIVSLYGDIEEKLKIEFYDQEKYVLLSDLCGCVKCRYIPLVFQVKFDGYFVIRCNERKEIKLNKTKQEYKHVYPGMNDGDKHYATIYFINTPAHNNEYPNSAQLYGCIFEILVNNKSVDFTKVGVKTVDKCQKTCSQNICNSGICHETYDTNPVCDCTHSFRNGDYCNEDGHSIKACLKSVKGQEFKFKYLKISWNSTSSEIFKMTNEKNEISIKANETTLTLWYVYSNGITSTTKGTVTGKYNSSSKSILVLTFEDIFIKYQYFENGVMKTNEELPIAHYLEKETFSSMVLLNNGGLIDLAYKMSTMDYIWNKVQITYADLFLSSRSNKNQSKGNGNSAFHLQKSLKSKRYGDIGYTFEFLSDPKMDLGITRNTLENSQKQNAKPFINLKINNSSQILGKYETKSSSLKMYFIVALGVTNSITLLLIFFLCMHFRYMARRRYNPVECEQKKSANGNFKNEIST